MLTPSQLNEIKERLQIAEQGKRTGLLYPVAISQSDIPALLETIEEKDKLIDDLKAELEQYRSVAKSLGATKA